MKRSLLSALSTAVCTAVSTVTGDRSRHVRGAWNPKNPDMKGETAGGDMGRRPGPHASDQAAGGSNPSEGVTGNPHQNGENPQRWAHWPEPGALHVSPRLEPSLSEAKPPTFCDWILVEQGCECQERVAGGRDSGY